MPQRDTELVASFVSATSQLGVAEAGWLVGVSHETVARWRRGKWKRLQPTTRRSVERYLTDEARQRDEAMAFAVAGGPAEGILEMLRTRGASLTVLHYIPRDVLVAGAMRVAVAEQWSQAERAKLSRFCFALLEPPRSPR